MTIIDTVQADQIEENDLILLDGEEIQVMKIIDSADEHAVTFVGYSLSTGDTETHELPFDYDVNILGA